MNKSVKAALLAAFVCPGVGHFFLKKYISSVVFFCAFLIPCFFIMRELLNKVQLIVDKISTGEIPLDALLLSEKLSALTTGDSAQSFNLHIYAVFAVWIISIVDSYRLGKKQS